MTVRIELEKDIKLLQEEVAALKHENRQLRSDKEDVERQFIEYKVKSEEAITKLRGKLAAISMGISPVPNHLIVEDRHGGGRLYHNASHGINIPTIKPHQQSPHVFLKAGAGGTLTPSFSSPVAPAGFVPSTPTGGIPYSSGENYTQLEGEGFRDPTFSELMRRFGVVCAFTLVLIAVSGIHLISPISRIPCVVLQTSASLCSSLLTTAQASYHPELILSILRAIITVTTRC